MSIPAYARGLTAVVAYVWSAQFVFVNLVQLPGNPDPFGRARLTAMVDGTASRPFVRRALLPGTVRAIDEVLPDEAGRWIEARALEFETVQGVLDATPAREDRRSIVYLIAYALEFACLIGLALTIRAALFHFYPGASALGEAVAPASMLLIPSLYSRFFYDYDLPHLFVFTLGLLLLARRDWTRYYPVLALVALSKETAILLPWVHLVAHRRSMPRRELWAHAACQAVLVVAVLAILELVVFAANPGVPAEFHLWHNLGMLGDPDQWRYLFFQFTWIGRRALYVPINLNILFLAVVPLIAWQWRAKPVFLCDASWIVVPSVALLLTFGLVDEIRACGELFPLGVLLASHTLLAAFGALPTAGSEPASEPGRSAEPTLERHEHMPSRRRAGGGARSS